MALKLIETRSGLILCSGYEQYSFAPDQELARYKDYICLNCSIEEAKNNAAALVKTHSLMANKNNLCTGLARKTIEI